MKYNNQILKNLFETVGFSRINLKKTVTDETQVKNLEISASLNAPKKIDDSP